MDGQGVQMALARLVCRSISGVDAPEVEVEVHLGTLNTSLQTTQE